MIKVNFFKREGFYYGFRESGHAEYDDPGKDIVCSAVSAMTMLVINAIEVSYASDVKYTIDDETNEVEVVCMAALPDYSDDEKKQYAISGLFEAYFLQLNDMLEDYYDYMDVTETEQ